MPPLPLLVQGPTAITRPAHAARVLISHYPPGAVSQLGRNVALRYLTNPDPGAASTLTALGPELFVPYVAPLRERLSWSDRLWGLTLQRVGVVESMLGCVHGCGMCYIDAPLPTLGSSMPWPHVVEVMHAIATERRRVLRAELLDVLVNDLLRGRLSPPFSILDAAIALVRHWRNRFGNYSDHLICYWKSNPTNWTDTLFGRDFADICQLVTEAFQLFDLAPLLAAIDADARATERFRSEFGEDAARLHFATSLHAVVSTVPVAPGSLGDRAVQRIIGSTPRGSELVRVSIPHPSMIRTGAGNPDRYWAAVQHSLRTATPRLVYVFAVTLDQLYEVLECISGSHERSTLQWWIESRLGIYEIREGRKRGDADEVIICRLRRILKHLCFTATLEGRGRQYAGSPFFEPRGTVMCVNGVVVAPDRRLHFQACTDPSGADLAAGRIIEDLHVMPESEVLEIVTGHPLVNRARELVTKGLQDIPAHEVRKPADWFATTVGTNQRDSRYPSALEAVRPVAERLLQLLRF